MKPTLTVTSDFTASFNETIRRFKNDDILVGIPEEKTDRKESSPINNATLLAICNFGSEKMGIPPWPVMAIGIRNARDEITAQFKRGAQEALTKGFAAISPAYNRVGIIASTSIKKVLNAQENVPEDKPAPSTLAARKSQGFKGKKYWIVTGQMRNAITYVVKGAK